MINNPFDPIMSKLIDVYIHTDNPVYQFAFMRNVFVVNNFKADTTAFELVNLYTAISHKPIDEVTLADSVTLYAILIACVDLDYPQSAYVFNNVDVQSLRYGLYFVDTVMAVYFVLSVST